MANVTGTLSPTLAPSFAEAAIYTQPYRAEFQHFRSSLCDNGDDPTVRVYCFGGSFRIDDTSDDIVCGDIQTRPGSQWQFIECTTSCTTDACRQSSFLNVNEFVDNVASGPFARVDFTCAGNLLANVNAGFEYLGGEAATCTSVTSNSLNYHIARLSVECPNEVTGEREFVLDDHYTECGSARPFSPDFGPSNNYHCEDGNFCEELTCDIEFDDFVINADVPLFAHMCTDSLLPIAAPTPPGPPPPTANTDTVFDSQYRATFGIFFEDQFDCMGNAPKVSISCPLGDITLINTTFATTSCTAVSNSVLECVDSVNAIDQFAEVNYNCTGFTEQDTLVEYQPNEAYCDDPVRAAHVSHMLQLGVACDVGSGLTTFFTDIAAECGLVGNEFDNVDAQGTRDSTTRFTCLERVLFPAGSTTADRETIPLVRMQTNYNWVDNPQEGCHFERPNLPPSPEPTSAPVPGPTAPPVRSPTQAPVEVVPKPAPTPSDSTSSSSSSSSVPLGAIIGGAVGAVAIISLAAILIVYIRSRGDNSAASKNNQPPKPIHYEEEQPPQDPTNTAGASESGHQDNLYGDDPYRGGHYGYDREPAAVASYAPSTRTNTSAATSSANSNGHRTADYSRRTPDYSTPGRPVQFKDQTRTVIEVPTVEGVATGAAPPPGMPMANAAPMMDVSEVTDHSGGNRSGGNRSGGGNHSRGGSNEPSGIRLDP